MDSVSAEGIIALKIPLTVISKSNYRHKGKSNWQRFKGFEEELILLVRESLPSDWKTTSYGHYFGVCIIANSKIDAGNLSKSILDALEGLLYKNDGDAKVVVAINSNYQENPTLDKENLLLIIYRAPKDKFDSKRALAKLNEETIFNQNF